MVLSIGHNVNVHRLEPIPDNVVVVRSAPQIELLKRAALCITHAGLNTTLESWPAACQWWRFPSATISQAWRCAFSITVQGKPYKFRK